MLLIVLWNVDADGGGSHKENQEAKQQNQRCNKVPREILRSTPTWNELRKSRSRVHWTKESTTNPHTNARTNIRTYIDINTREDSIYCFTVSNNNRENCFEAKKKSSFMFVHIDKIIGNVERKIFRYASFTYTTFHFWTLALNGRS